MRINVLGVGFDDLTLDEAVDRAFELIGQRRGAYAVTPNPEIVQLCRSDETAREAVNNADLVLADGIGIIKAASILGTPLKDRVPGIDFAQAMFARLAQTGGTVFLFGARPGVAQLAAEKLSERFAGLRIVGTNDGYFDDDAPIIEKINSAKPDFLLVCLGAPKQEKWMLENRASLDVGLMAGLGGSLDVFSGTVRRAPEEWRKMGLEWLYRLLKEPRRIGRMAKLPLFLVDAAAERLGGKKR